MIAVGLALRLWRLDTCLWLDEVLTMVEFARKPIAEILTSFPNQNQHMLYSLLAHASLGVFGESAWALRIPAVLFSTAAIWALFLLGRKVISDRAALFACGLMTVSYHHVWFAQNARGYSALLFFATIATWLWLEALERNTWRWWTWYGIVCCLGVLAHLTMVFVLAAQALVWIVGVARRERIERVNGWKPAGAWILGATLTLQVLALSLPQFLREALHESSMNSEWTNPLWALREAIRSFQLGFSGGAVVAGAAAFLLLGWFSIFRRDGRAAFAIVLPGVLGGLVMVALGHNLWPRFFFFSAGCALLIVIDGAMAAGRITAAAIRPLAVIRSAAPAIGASFASLILVASAITLPRCYQLPKQDYTAARDFAEADRRSDEAIVAVGLAARVYRSYYAQHWLEAGSSEELEALRRQYKSVVLVYTLPYELQAFKPGLWNAIENAFEPARIFPGTLGGGEVYVCRERLRTRTRTERISY
jgi:4-amino-4-deoxy-L-arabinose transferase-like glycosyltransferase